MGYELGTPYIISYKFGIPYFMIDNCRRLYKNKENVLLILIIFLMIYLLFYRKIETKKEKFDSKKREMYVPNCNFLTDANVCNDTQGCKVINDKCYYDWINL